MKKIILLILILNSLYLYAGEYDKVNINEAFELKRQYIIDDEINPYSFLLKDGGDKIYGLNNKIASFSKGDSIELFVFDDKIEKRYLKSPEELWVTSFEVIDDVVYLLANETVYLYDLKADSIYCYKKLDIGFYSFDIEHIDGKLIFRKICYTCADPGTYFRYYDLSRGELSKKVKLKDPDDLKLTYYHPKKLLVYRDEKIYVSDILNYRINIYDLDGNYIDKIESDEKWHRTEAFDHLMKAEYATDIDFRKKSGEVREEARKIDMIQRIDFLDNDCFMINRACPNIEEKSAGYKLFDFWYRENGSWKKDDASYVKYRDRDSLVYNYENALYISLEYWVVGNKLLMYNKNPFMIEEYSGKYTVGEIKQKQEEYYIDNDLKTSVYVLEYKKKK